jgi:putative addiction module antidote
MAIKVKARPIGNSTGFIIPEQILRRLNIRRGDEVFLTDAPDGSIRLTPYNPEFERQLEAAQEIMHRRRNALRALAK